MPRFLTAFVLCALVLLAGGAGHAAAAQKGVVPDCMWSVPQADSERTAGLIADVGAQWVAMDLVWYATEPAKGQYEGAILDKLDHCIALARGAGARVIIAVYRAPRWARATDAATDPPVDEQDFADFMTVVAARYHGKVAAWRIWNEPDHPAFWTQPSDPAHYGRIVKAAHRAIKSVSPGTTVVVGGTSHNNYPYLERVYEAHPDLGNYFDVMATHPYTAHGVSPETIVRDSDGRIHHKYFPAYREVRSMMLSYGDNKPIWLTEFGWATVDQPDPNLGGVDEATQADYLTRAYKYLEQDSYVQVALWYNFRNTFFANDQQAWIHQLGLMRTDFSPKLAYAAFKAYAPPATRPAGTTQSGAPTSTVGQPVAGPDPLSEGAVLKPTSTAVRARRRSRSATVVVNGSVRGTGSGRVVIEIEKRRPGSRRWHRHGARMVSLRPAGTFSRRIRLARKMDWRLRAVYPGSTGTAPSRSRPVAVRATRG